MLKRNDTLEAIPPAKTGTFGIRVHDVTGTHDMSIEGIPRGALASSVAQSLAARMDLPTDVPWSLRSDRTGTWLRDDAPLDEQVDTAAEEPVTLTAKTHLGGKGRE